jgi:ferredoxin
VKVQVRINERRCLGCGGCMEQHPALFRLGSEHSQYIGCDDLRRCETLPITECMQNCPVKAISLHHITQAQ